MSARGSSFHTDIKNASFSSSIDVGSHNPPPFEAQRPRWHSFPSPIDVGPTNLLPSGSSVLAGTPPHVHPLRSSASLLTHLLMSGFDVICHLLMSGFDTICNAPSLPLADIILFGFSLLGFPSRFLKPLSRMLRSPPYRCGISQLIFVLSPILKMFLGS